jgi:hypothetical protein
MRAGRRTRTSSTGTRRAVSRALQDVVDAARRHGARPLLQATRGRWVAPARAAGHALLLIRARRRLTRGVPPLAPSTRCRCFPMIHRAGRSSTQSRRCLKLPYQIMAPLGLPCPCRCCSELPISCRLGGIYIFAIITVGTSSKAILRINLTVLPFLYETQFKIAIFTDVARHDSIGCMPREHHRAKFRPCPCLQLPSSTDMCDPHVSVVFNLKTKADACRSATIPSPVPGAPSPGPTRPLPVVAVALAPSGRQSSSTASKIRTTSNAVPRRHPTWRAGSGGASSPRHQRRALPLDRRPTPLPLDGHGQRPPG